MTGVTGQSFMCQSFMCLFGSLFLGPTGMGDFVFFRNLFVFPGCRGFWAL